MSRETAHVASTIVVRFKLNRRFMQHQFTLLTSILSTLSSMDPTRQMLPPSTPQGRELSARTSSTPFNATPREMTPNPTPSRTQNVVSRRNGVHFFLLTL